jgi:hypothetical protein
VMHSDRAVTPDEELIDVSGLHTASLRLEDLSE